MESARQTILPETLPITSVSEEVPAGDSVVGVSRSLPTSLNADGSSSAEMQRLSAPLSPPLVPETQIDSTVQELQYGSKIDKEKSHTNQVQPPREAAGLVVITGTKEKQSITLEYKPETGTKVELCGKEHTGGNILLRPKSQICFRAPVPSVSQSSVVIKVQDTTEHRDMVLDSETSTIPLPSSGNGEIKQSDLSKTQPKITTELSADAREMQKANSLESVEMSEPVKELVDTSHNERQPPSAAILGTNIQRSCDPLVGEQAESSMKEDQTDTSSSDITMLPECSFSQESYSKPSAAPPLFVSVQTEPVVESETSHPCEQETPLTAELVHSAEAQEIVVVREEAHISGDWTNMHLNQSYLLQREDGSICEAAIVNQLSSGEPKLYEESVQADIEMDSQPVEVYEFCTLVEEVAEEVCASSSALVPHSPGYEVNLFNALLEHSVDLEPAIHTLNESEPVIISQEPSASHDANQIQANLNSHSLSIQNTGAAAVVRQHLVLDANQAVQVANSSEVSLVEVAADSFTVEQTDTGQQTPCSQVNEAISDQTELGDSPAIQRTLLKQEAEATAGALSFIAPSLNQTVSATKREACVSSHEGTKETPPALTETPSQKIQNVAVPTETKPEAFCTTRISGTINPKLLRLKPGETPLLKHPPSILARLSKQQNAAGKLAVNDHSSEECLPQTVSDSLCAPVALGVQKDQTQCSDNTISVSAAPPVKVQQPTTSGISLQPVQTASVTTSTSKSDKEALNVTETTSEESQDVVTPTTSNSYMLSAPVEREDEASTSLNDPPSQQDSLHVEEESEDMEPDEPTDETEAQEDASGQVSSPEEGSDEEPDCDKTEGGMNTPSSPNKVRQWIADRVTENSSPVPPSTSSSYPGPSPSSDWSNLQRDKSSPLRGPHGKFVSPISTGGRCSSSSSPPEQVTPQRPRGERHTDMAELAKHEADIEHRTQSLKREGFWSMKRLTRLTEPPRPKVHWDYLCEEMQWLSADFAQERRWKRGVARKVVRMVMKYHEELRQKEEKAKRDEHSKIRRVASSIAKEVRAFWSSVEKVVQYKQQSRLEEKRKKALDLQLDFIVGQTEKYSDLLSQSLAPTGPAEDEPEPVTETPPKPATPAADEEDRDFEPPCEEEDDEQTLDVEEQQEGNDAESHRREIELLKEEGMLPLDQLLSTIKLAQESVSDGECSDESSSSKVKEEEDGEFAANEEDAKDEEDTIDDQEKVEGDVNHAEELDDLAREGEMSVEELLEKYKGAYASDFEAPSGSGSKESSDSEVSGDEEEETEEDESDVESNSSSSDSAGESRQDDDSEKEEEGSEEEEEDDGCEDEGMEVLLKEGDNSPPSSSSRPKKEISHIAATAESLQPKGYTLATAKVKTPIPFLLHGTLREYQHIGLDWLVTMYEKKLNGILADEMGLGKTIQTIALLAHLALEKSNWGPHLIIVPTSVMLNWEMELKRWCPGFKILTYFGSQKERKLKRQGWTKPNAFHVCITSYKLVLQDHQAFRRKSWRYLILDEAQNIKNFKSQRWQSLLNFNSHRRLLLTGTPLQNSLMELWSLMHFLMPHVFQSHREFKEWFSNPLTGMIEGSQEYNEGLVKRLHKVLRPFLLRRIKIDVEKQMPKKYEHVVRCRLSKRQRFLYDDFMAQASTRETLASGHFMSVINILMQLRKVCNHPNLFDPRPIQSPFITKPIVFHTASLAMDALEISPLKRCDLSMFDLVGLESRVSRYQADIFLPRHKVNRQLIQEVMDYPEPPPRPKPVRMKVNRMFQPPPKSDNRPVLLMNKPTCSVPPAAQTPKSLVAEVSTAAAPVVQQVVCTVATTAPPRLPMHPAQIAVRASAPKPVLTVRPPTASCTTSIAAHPGPVPGSVLPQRVLLSPDMQARLPSGEVVSIAQLASLAGRPVSCQGSKPVTFQLQGNKLTLSGAQLHQVPAASPRSVQGNVMHLVTSGMQHHLISQTTQVTVQSAVSTSATAPASNRMPHNITAQVVPSLVSSPGVVKIVVRQTAGKDGGPVPTLAVAPSPRFGPLASLSPHPHATTTPVRIPAPLQIAQRTPGPATAHYTIAPPGNPSSTPNQLHPTRPILKVVQPPPPSTEQPAPVQVSSSSSASKPLAAPHESSNSNNSSQTPATTKSRPSAKPLPPPRRRPPPPPRSPFHLAWMAESQKQQRDSRLDFIIRVNENRCAAKPMYGREVLNFLTFLPGSHPSPAPLSAQGEWGRSGHSSALYAQWQNKSDFWFQSQAVREAIHSIDDRLELLNPIIDRFTFAIPPVEARPISMHCCHPPPSLSHKQAVFSTQLSAQVTPLARSLHRIQCYTRTQFPDLRLIQYDCGKLQTLHTLLRKLKTGSHRVLIFTQMTRMLDVLEQFLNYHGHIYLRLDGSTRVEMRQSLMERFNADRRIFCFILSTRSGGVGVNLTGADTVVFYDSDWNPTMDAQAQDRCHRIGQTRDVHIYRLISERTVEENILKKANQKRILGDMAIEGGNFTTAFFKEQTIRDLFDMNDGEKKEAAVELTVSQPEEEEAVNKQSTTILEQALCRAEDEEDIVAASQAKAEQVAELAEFNENIPLDDAGEQEEVEELSKAEQEIAALVEQLTPIERYAMNFLEASLEDVCKEELKQAEEQVEAARKGLDQAKEEGLKLNASSDDDDNDSSLTASVEPTQPGRRGRKPKEASKNVSSTRTSGRLRGASPETEPEKSPTSPKEVPERLRCGLRRGAAKDSDTVSTTPSHTDDNKTSSSTRLQDSSKSSKASSPARDQHTIKTRTLPNRSHSSPVPSPPTSSPPTRKQPSLGETDSKTSKDCREEKESESLPESSFPVDHEAKDYDTKDHSAMSPPSTSSRSPRKRQSADEEVLRGLVEDSPSAKVLRKLPGRLVTVVGEKEPRRRRRRGSGTGASSEEATAEENPSGSVEESNTKDNTKDNPSPSSDSKTKGAVAQFPQDQDSTPKPSVHHPPVRSYAPYSPAHLSPDMPVLRNLPVRRRLETESRMAAQLGEQLLSRGRANQSRKTETTPGKDTTSTESNVNSLAGNLKRKRGRPPKTPPRLPEAGNTVASSPQPTSQSEEGNPPNSPKRKRGRPRKDSTTSPETISEEQNSKNESTENDASKEPTVLSLNVSETPIADVITTSQDSQSTKAEEMDTKSEVSTPAPNPAQAHTTTTTDTVSKPALPLSPTVPAPLPVAASTPVSAQFLNSDLTSVPSSDTAHPQVSSVTHSMSAVTTTTHAAPLVPTSTVASTNKGVKPTAANTHIQPKPSVSTTAKAQVEPKPLVSTTPKAQVELKPSVSTTPKAQVEPKPSVSTTPKAQVEPNPSVSTTPKAQVEFKPSVSTTCTTQVEPKPSVSTTSAAPVEPKPSVSTTSTASVEPKPSVSTTSAAPVEPKPSVSTTSAAPVEPKPSVSTTCTTPVESKPSVSTTSAAPVEPKPLVSTTAADPVEPKPSVSTTSAAPVEPKPSVSTASAAPVEPKPSVSTTSAAPVEPKPSVSTTSAAPVEPKPSVSTTSAAPVEPKPSVSTTSAAPVEPKPSVSTTSAAPVEPKPSVSTASAAPVEPKPSVSTTSAAPVEPKPSVSTTSAAPVEPKPSVSTTSAAPVEPKPSVSTTSAAPVEPKPSVSTASAASVEPKPSVSTTSAASVEPKPSVSTTSAAPVEPKPSVSTTSTAPVESKPSVSTTSAAPVEPKPSVSTTSTAPVESKPSVSTTSTAPVEPKPSVSTTSAAPVESKPSVSTTSAAPVEPKPSVSTTSAAPVEPKPSVSTTSAAPVEPKPSVSTTSAAPVEPKPSVSTTSAAPVEPKPSVSTTSAAPVEPKPSVSTTSAAPVEPKPSVSTTSAAPVEPKPSVSTTSAAAVEPKPSVSTTSAAAVVPKPSVPTTCKAQVEPKLSVSTTSKACKEPIPSPITNSQALVEPEIAHTTTSKASVEPKQSVSSTTVKTTDPGPAKTTTVAPPAASTPLTLPSSMMAVKAVPTSIPATATANKGISETVRITSPVTTVKSVTSKNTAVKDLPQASSLPSTTSTSAVVTSTPPTASPKPTSTSSPTSATTTLTVKSVQASPSDASTVSTEHPTTPASRIPSESSVSSSAANTVPSSPRTNLTPTKPDSTIAPTHEGGYIKCPLPTTATSTTVTTTAKEKAVAVTEKTEKVQVTTPLETASPSKEQTTAEKTVKIPSPVTTSTPAPLPTVTTTTSPPEKSMTVSTTNIKTTRVSSAIVAPVTRSTVEVNPTNTVPVSTRQTTPDASLQVQCSASSEVPTPAPSIVTSEKQSLKHKAPASKSDPDGLEEVGKTEAEAKASKEEDQDEETDIRKSQRKRRKVESSSGAKDFESSRKGTLRGSAAQKEEPKQKGSEQTPIQKRPLSRQSSQDSARSSSSSSGCSTLTRQAHHKRTYENRLPTKKRRMGNEENNKEDKKHTSRGRRSRSSSSSDSDTSEHREEHRLTRSAKHRLQHQEKEKGNSQQGKTPDRSASNNTNASTGGESGSDTSSVRITRKSAGSKSSQESKAQTNSVPLIPPEPEVLGKRCSALNAAAKLLAMKGRVDTPGHTTRKDYGAKAAGTSPASSDKNQKPKSKIVPASPQSNSLNLSNNKSSSSKTLTPNQTSHSASRSTRQRPGSLVPPLEVEYKRSKADEKDRGARRSSRIKEGEAEALSSSRGHSACSSVSSDGEGDAGGRSSRSRSSSSNSSQRTRSISSQNTERRESRATSSGSERERDRSSESRDKRDRHRRESLRSHKLTQEVTSSSGAEGTPDRVLRSVAALAAVQARSPAASTRSSFGHHRHNKT
ncbi:helicase SRCAP isoform X2 [Gymnodraco acuticeps]|uniref:Helicase SRCAP isoform X2 n=1 Tax=Gymnodraco acuticeps TaxID=8218 RepID=A0A6P8U9C5_GYMAC|nr:helicase SRCAP isoform X2 [Gymnodraco acuticeps]